MKNISIIYAGGQYGTFIEWCLNYFTDYDFSSELPFNTNGNSHKFKGNHLHDIHGCKNYILSGNNYKFVRFHLRASHFTDLQVLENFQYVSNNFKNVIFINSSEQSLALCLNNKFEKINFNFLTAHTHYINSMIKNWGENKDLTNIEQWELREFLSGFLYSQYTSESCWSIADKFDNCIKLSVDDLINNFEYTITNLIEKLELKLVRTNFSEVYESWISLQKHINKDKIISNIITAILDNNYYDWSDQNLTLVDEALVQFYLRQKKIDLNCYNLNVFPTNTTELKKYFNYVT